MDSAIGDSFETAVSQLTGMGHQIKPLTMADAVPTRLLIYSIADEVATVHREFRERGEPYGDDVAERLDSAERVTASEKEEAAKWRSMIKARFAEAFEEVDLLLTPTVPIRRKVIGEDFIEGRHYRAYLSYFTSLVNQSLHPAIAMPLADSGSPPASMQAIGPLWSELSLIALSRSLEETGVARFTPAPGSSTIASDG